MGKADALTYEVDYLVFSGLGAVDQLIEFATDHGNSVELNVYGDAGTLYFNQLWLTSPAGQRVEVAVGQCLVWNRDRFVALDAGEFANRFEVRSV